MSFISSQRQCKLATDSVWLIRLCSTRKRSWNDRMIKLCQANRTVTSSRIFWKTLTEKEDNIEMTWNNSPELVIDFMLMCTLNIFLFYHIYKHTSCFILCCVKFSCIIRHFSLFLMLPLLLYVQTYITVLPLIYVLYSSIFILTVLYIQTFILFVVHF